MESGDGDKAGMPNDGSAYSDQSLDQASGEAKDCVLGGVKHYEPWSALKAAAGSSFQYAPDQVRAQGEELPNRWHYGADWYDQNRVGFMQNQISLEKVAAWLSEANRDQCLWAIQYLCFRTLPVPVDVRGVGDWSIGQLKGFINWLFLGEGVSYHGTEVQSVQVIRSEQLKHFKRMRNAWNQRVNRQKKKLEVDNTVYLGEGAKEELSSIARAHGMSESECLEILVGLAYERRASLSDLKARRKEAKRRALAEDVGIL